MEDKPRVENPKTLRDYFAARAMCAQVISVGTNGDTLTNLHHLAKGKGMDVEQYIAWASYQMADAMLAEREKPQEARP